MNLWSPLGRRFCIHMFGVPSTDWAVHKEPNTRGVHKLFAVCSCLHQALSTSHSPRGFLNGHGVLDGTSYFLVLLVHFSKQELTCLEQQHNNPASRMYVSTAPLKSDASGCLMLMHHAQPSRLMSIFRRLGQKRSMNSRDG